jgi:hypothetical protein
MYRGKYILPSEVPTVGLKLKLEVHSITYLW